MKSYELVNYYEVVKKYDFVILNKVIKKCDFVDYYGAMKN